MIAEEYILASFDVELLFAEVPIHDTMDISRKNIKTADYT